MGSLGDREVVARAEKEVGLEAKGMIVAGFERKKIGAYGFEVLVIVRFGLL